MKSTIDNYDNDDCDNCGQKYTDDILQIGFGFCKGDDNFGGGRRKALDDYTKVTCYHISLMFELRIDHLVVEIKAQILKLGQEDEPRADGDVDHLMMTHESHLSNQYIWK